MPCSQQVFVVLLLQSGTGSSEGPTPASAFGESMWFRKSCWVNDVFIGPAECRFLHVPLDPRQELAEVFATICNKDIEDTFNCHPSCVTSRLARQFVSGRAMAWRNTLDAAVRRWTERSNDNTRWPSTRNCDVCCERGRGKIQLRVILGVEEMTEWIKDKDVITLSSETHLNLPLQGGANCLCQGCSPHQRRSCWSLRCIGSSLLCQVWHMPAAQGTKLGHLEHGAT